MLSFKYFVEGEVWEQRQHLKAFAAMCTLTGLSNEGKMSRFLMTGNMLSEKV